jgi:hypothetical protein
VRKAKIEMSLIVVALAAPFAALIFGIAADSPAIGRLAGASAALLVDPVVAISGLLGAVIGATGRSWKLAGAAALIGGIGAALGYGWWRQIGADGAANQAAAAVTIGTVAISMYGFLAGRLYHLLSSPTQAPTAR